jgi:hypothetical protein
MFSSTIQEIFYSPKKSSWHQNLIPKLVHDPLPGTYGIKRIWAPMKEPPPMALMMMRWTLPDACMVI